ncbi:hypothetical protein C942_01438 [Photobacterium marinum]|uniref:Uncharacterized protein n=1 Tax=Photobacterium marinum TaxID=1056511 RepID=L8JJ32_9GAMM|nr:hypothetical protein C942_01438 [Photobacterium marinum]
MKPHNTRLLKFFSHKVSGIVDTMEVCACSVFESSHCCNTLRGSARW